MSDDRTQRVVVGIDGSVHARAALAVAVAEARRRSATLDILHAWSTPLVMAPMGAVPPWPRSVQRDLANELLDHVAAEVPDDVDVVTRSIEGHPASALIEASEGADLVVVGSRGRGGFAGLVLGSTSHQVTAHAHCPVLVLPVTATERDDDSLEAARLDGTP